MKARKRLLIIPLILIFALLLFVIFFAGNDAGEMTPYEYLSHIVPPEERFISDDGSVWYRTSAFENYSQLELMAPVADRAGYKHLSMHALSSTGSTLYVNAENHGDRTEKTLKTDTYLSVKLADGEWYPIPAVDTVYAGHLEAGETETLRVELRQEAGGEYALPSGEYRFEYYAFDSEIRRFRFAVAEFKLVRKFGRYWIM